MKHHNTHLKVIAVLFTTLSSIASLHSCKTDKGSDDGNGNAPVAPGSPAPASSDATVQQPTPGPVATTPTPTPTVVDQSTSTAQTASLTACANAWQKAKIANAPTTANFAQARFIDASAQATATDPAPPQSGAAASLVLIKFGAVTTSAQLYGASTWYCIDNASVPGTVAIRAQLCNSGHAADGSPGVGAKALRFIKNRNC